MAERHRAEMLLPYQYELIWQLAHEPLTAGEVGFLVGRRHGDPNGWTAQATAARLRPLVKRGWVERDETGIYTGSERAIAAVSW